MRIGMGLTCFPGKPQRKELRRWEGLKRWILSPRHSGLSSRFRSTSARLSRNRYRACPVQSPPCTAGTSRQTSRLTCVASAGLVPRLE